MKIRPVGAELLSADGGTDGRTDSQADRLGEAKSHFSQFCERAYKCINFPQLMVRIVKFKSIMAQPHVNTGATRKCNVAKQRSTQKLLWKFGIDFLMLSSTHCVILHLQHVCNVSSWRYAYQGMPLVCRSGSGIWQVTDKLLTGKNITVKLDDSCH
jgi:hypothetical protein